MIARERIRDTSQRRRHEGLSALDITSLQQTMNNIVPMLHLAIILPTGLLKSIVMLAIVHLFTIVRTMLFRDYQPVDPIDPTNKNRLIHSFSEEECWDYFRLRRCQLSELVRLLQIPAYFVCENRLTCPGEHALCVYLYHISYPTKLQRMQNVFGREMSEISRIEKVLKAFLIPRYRRFVVGNLDWYADRFDAYAHSFNRAIAYSHHNNNPGTLPPQLINIVGCVDGCAFPVSRITGFNNAQNSFWNRYYHSHIVLWIGVGFPDGMIVLDPPNAGYMTDPMAWPNSTIRADMIAINEERMARNEEPVRLYADKIFRTDMIIVAAYSAAFGFVQPWMHALNRIMAPLRVSVEWSYGKVKYLYKSLSFKLAQKLMRNQPVEDFILATFFTNCRTCYQWDGPFQRTFGVQPPSIYDYLDQ